MVEVQGLEPRKVRFRKSSNPVVTTTNHKETANSAVHPFVVGIVEVNGAKQRTRVISLSSIE